ncbi:MAG: 3-phosphoshikimate 1-carboxyvinyltransferase [Alistipes sp.]|nr:3-phosphoshikimate 1-carboxyvinyltransferase [Alistipes sp.]
MDKSVSAGPIKGIVIPPSSKSYAQRAIALSLLAEGTTTLRNIEFCKDTLSALSCVKALGAQVEFIDDSTIRIKGGLSPLSNTLHVGESGLATRLFTPIAALSSVPIRIEGEGTLLHRPMQMMIEPLRTLGVQLKDGGGYLPFEVQGPIKGGKVRVDGSISSQFITGLLLALPLAEQDTTLYVDSAVSTPYLDMTIDTARRFGVEILHNQGDYSEFFIEGGQHYSPTDIAIEGDWSGASTLMVAGAIAGEVSIKNLSTLSRQADTVICQALERAGAGLIIEDDTITVTRRPLRAFSFDATHCPDLFPALVALAAAADGQSTIIGTERLRHKESDRAETLREEYEKLGIEVDLSEDNIMKIRGGNIQPAVVHSHDDHRIAMSLAVSALRCGDAITIRNAECVEKSYPSFFEDLESLIIR